MQVLRAARFVEAAALLAEPARSIIKPELVWQIEAGMRLRKGEVRALRAPADNRKVFRIAPTLNQDTSAPPLIQDISTTHHLRGCGDTYWVWLCVRVPVGTYVPGANCACVTGPQAGV